MNNSKEFLGTEPIGKLLFKLAVPSVIAQIVNMLYNIVDRIYIGHIPGSGSLALTGVGVCLPIIMVVSAFAALVGSGGAPRASIFMGKDDMDSAEKILSGCFTVQIIISAILTAVLLLFGRSMLLTFATTKPPWPCNTVLFFTITFWQGSPRLRPSSSLPDLIQMASSPASKILLIINAFLQDSKSKASPF